MRWSKRFLRFVGTVLAGAVVVIANVVTLGACGRETSRFDDTDEGDLSPDPHPACAGLCVHTPPATYTGPSLFWIGSPQNVQSCPPDTPYQGIEGFVTSPMFLQYARECRITPTDACKTEGLTCAPLPDVDYHVCIHHDDERPCPNEYPERRTMVDDASSATVTICCLESPGPA